MSSLLIRERYKIVRTLWQQQDYAAVEAVDIQDRETPSCLLNCYEGSLFHRYGEIYSQIRPEHCPPFQRAFLEGETLVAVFHNCLGAPIDQVFFQGDHWSWQDRLFYAQELLHQALLLSDLPPEIACAPLLSPNLLIDTADRKVALRFLVRPLALTDARELPLLAQDQLKKVLPYQLSMPAVQLELLRRLEGPPFPSMASLYAHWRKTLPDIKAGYEEYEQKNIFQKGIYNIKCWFSLRKRGGSE